MRDIRKMFGPILLILKPSRWAKLTNDVFQRFKYKMSKLLLMLSCKIIAICIGLQ